MRFSAKADLITSLCPRPRVQNVSNVFRTFEARLSSIEQPDRVFRGRRTQVHAALHRRKVRVAAGVKYKGLSLEAEYYWRWLRDFRGVNTSTIPVINDHGYQVQAF